MVSLLLCRVFHPYNNEYKSLRPCFAAAKLLSDENLDIVCCESINAKYTFKRTSKTIPTTSCAESSNEGKTTIFITQNYDWFDVGTSIGSMILQRCQLEDAFFVSSIMEASLQTLRYRGFPVDRILRPGTHDFLHCSFKHKFC